MGCVSSSEARRGGGGRQRSQDPYFRNKSMPVGRRPKVGDIDRHHVVGLTSSTLGFLRLDSARHRPPFSDDEEESMMKPINDDKSWSNMIESKLKTPAKSPEPETIDAWELMEGLEEAAAAAADGAKDLGYNVANIASSRDKCEMPKFMGIVKSRITAFQQEIDAKRRRKCPPNGERKVVFYFTSLRGIRKTYEDCWDAKVILHGYGVKIDERDVSMHGGFREELSEMVGTGLPRVFANGRYLGGAEEVRQLHEAGELGRALEECEAAVVGKGGGVCEGCGGVRFVPCETCNGSCKVFVEEEEEEEVGGGGFRRCLDCNENGLVLCPSCL